MCHSLAVLLQSHGWMALRIYVKVKGRIIRGITRALKRTLVEPHEHMNEHNSQYGIGTHSSSVLDCAFSLLTHWGRATHICVSRLIITGSDNGLSPGRRQAIIWTNAGILLIGPLGTNFSENSIEILTFSFTKMRLKVSSAKWRPFCLGLNV